MNPKNLPPTNTTPEILFAQDSLVIRGRSIPMSDANFYDPFIEWAKKVNSDHFHVEIKLEYMNSSSSKKLLHLLKSLDSNASVAKLKISWYYEEGDEESKDHGQLFEKLLKNSEFRFIKYRDGE